MTRTNSRRTAFLVDLPGTLKVTLQFAPENGWLEDDRFFLEGPFFGG